MHRRESCEHYDDCLDEAVANKWKSFSCLGCTNHKLKVVVVEIYPDAPAEPPELGAMAGSQLSMLLTEKMKKFGIQSDGGGKRWGWGKLPRKKAE